MQRWFTIVLIALVVSACGQKGPLVLPEQASRKPAAPAAHDVPPTQEQRQ